MVPPDGLRADLGAAGRRIVQLCAQEPPTRLVRTRHGDAMLLTDFLTTRVVELAVHGLDLAAALNRPPWPTAPAAELLTALLRNGAPVPGLGWDQATFIAQATGRLPLTPAEAHRLDESGISWLSPG